MGGNCCFPPMKLFIFDRFYHLCVFMLLFNFAERKGGPLLVLCYIVALGGGRDTKKVGNRRNFSQCLPPWGENARKIGGCR